MRMGSNQPAGQDEPSRSWLRRSRTGEIRSVPGSGAVPWARPGAKCTVLLDPSVVFGECRNSVVFLRLMPEAA